jgi:tRNA A37 methylthiotransferase MiaB
VQESLDAIGEALAENGKVIVTGCLGAKKDADGNDLIQGCIRKCWKSPDRTRLVKSWPQFISIFRSHMNRLST